MSCYTINWEKYKRISLGQCCSMEREFRRTFHTCPVLMEKKKELETLVRRCNFNTALKKHFQTEYRDRKEIFYQKILTEDLLGDSASEAQIQMLVKDIIYIYSKKAEELQYLTWKANDLDAELEQEELHREYMIESFREYDF